MSVIASVGLRSFKYHNLFLLCLRKTLHPVYRFSNLRNSFKGSIIFRAMGDKPPKTEDSKEDLKKESKEELKKRLTSIQYQVTQEKGTERAFTGKYNKCKDIGIYSCVVCSQDLFSSATKFESGCGWPSFNDVIDQGKVKLSKDTSHVGANLLLLIANPGMVRTEVTCSFCGAHLGHVFNDGPKPTRRRFCINSASLNFRPATEEAEPKPANGS